VDGATIDTRTRGTTVADALAEAGVALMGLDFTVPHEDTPLGQQAIIRVVRVKEQLVSEIAYLPYETERQADDTLEIDQSVIRQAGVPGVLRSTARVRYEDGVEVLREPASSVLVQAPQNEIVAYGTNIVVRTVDTPEGPLPYWRTVEVYATSYHPAALGGDDITATGQRLQRGIIAADTDLFPFGTRLYVPGYGVGVVQDTGPQRSDPYWIDLGYSDADWRSWSRRVQVYVLGTTPGE
jgi:3D (Asp-Asp-Asp) domain-containing protein